jgi:probable DNA repair protein
VADRHRAAAVRLAWARHQQREGREAWSTPAVHTWNAWLSHQWRSAAMRGDVPPLQLLDTSQERVLWEGVLADIWPTGGDDAALTQHATALMNAAARATQAELALRQSAQSAEELLLADALVRVRAIMASRGLLSLRLAPAQSLTFLADVPAPLVVGEPHLTSLQQTLARLCWPGVPLLAPLPGDEPVEPARMVAADLEQEIAACAAWCREHLVRSDSARLLVLSACTEPALPIQADLLWRALSPDNPGDDAQHRRWLAVEGGAPLLHQALVSDALLALRLAEGTTEIDTADVLTLLRSPYFSFGSLQEVTVLCTWLADTGLASFGRSALQDALRIAADKHACARQLVEWLAIPPAHPLPQATQGATEWATHFSTRLEGAGFARPAQLDSRDQQRLARWHELLDEFAALDAVLPPLTAKAALQRLQQLAAQARHQPATADAAITFSGQLADPVTCHDGIWVLGLSDARWPAPPRPNPWIEPGEQRRAGWPEAGVTQRRAQALWALQCWQRRTTDLVVSHPAREADIAHRPPALPGPGQWRAVALSGTAASTGQSRPDKDQQLAPIGEVQRARPLGGGAARLDIQQDCPFRAQAWWRLGAEPPARLCDGVPASLRGRLLHELLQHLWQRRVDPAALLRLDATGEQRLLESCWSAAVQDTREARWLPARVLGRERGRALEIAASLLRLERQRPPFTVAQREQLAVWQGAGASLSLRIDRVDRAGADVILLDYKSGAAPRVALHEGELRPLQLAIYAAALAQQGMAVNAAALVELTAAETGFTGVAASDGPRMPGLQPVPDWPAMQQHWQGQLQQLMAQHLSGAATLTRDRRTCQRCHLPALCRRAGAEDAETDDE